MKDLKNILSDLAAMISPPSGEAKIAEYIKEYIKETAPDAEVSARGERIRSRTAR